jgi:hypothetical protein
LCNATLQHGRGFAFAHGGFLWDQKITFDITKSVPDLWYDADLAALRPVRVALFFFAPLVSVAVWQAFKPAYRAATGRAPGVIAAAVAAFRKIVFYYYIPVVATWHNSMLINSALHTWGYESMGDAMSGPCDSKNMPLLAPFMLGEHNHNNHHGEPTALDSQLAWWEVDFWPLLVGALQKVGAVTHIRPQRAHRVQAAAAAAAAGVGDTVAAAAATLSGVNPSQPSLSDFSVTLPVAVQLFIAAFVVVAIVVWRRRALRAAKRDTTFTVFVLVCALAHVLCAIHYVISRFCANAIFCCSCVFILRSPCLQSGVSHFILFVKSNCTRHTCTLTHLHAHI